MTTFEAIAAYTGLAIVAGAISYVGFYLCLELVGILKKAFVGHSNRLFIKNLKKLVIPFQTELVTRSTRHGTTDQHALVLEFFEALGTLEHRSNTDDLHREIKRVTRLIGDVLYGKEEEQNETPD